MLNDEIRPAGIVRRGVLLEAGGPSLLLGAVVRFERLLYRAALVALPAAGLLGGAAGAWSVWPDAGRAVLAAPLGALLGAGALCILFVLIVAAVQLAIGRTYRNALAQACGVEGARLIGSAPDIVEIERHWSFRETSAFGLSRDAGMVVQLGHATGWHVTLLPLERVSGVTVSASGAGKAWGRGAPAHVTLYWTDASGEPGATVAWFGRDDAAAERLHAALSEALLPFR